MSSGSANADDELRGLIEALHGARPGQDRARARNELARAMSGIARRFAEWQSRTLPPSVDWEGIAQDVVIDVLDSWEAMATPPPRPGAYIRVALQNRIASHARRTRYYASIQAGDQERARLVAPVEAGAAFAGRLDAPDAKLEAKERLARIVASTPPRELGIIIAVAASEETREEIAMRHGVSRAAIDQIVSRFRKRLSEVQAAEPEP